MFDVPDGDRGDAAYVSGGGLNLNSEKRSDAKRYLYTETRRLEIAEGQESMLYRRGWIFCGPANHKGTELGRYWINPRSGYKYTQRGAVDLEELREGLRHEGSLGHKQQVHLAALAAARATGARKRKSDNLMNKGAGGPRINFIEPKRRNRNVRKTKTKKEME